MRHDNLICTFRLTTTHLHTLDNTDSLMSQQSGGPPPPDGPRGQDNQPILSALPSVKPQKQPPKSQAAASRWTPAQVAMRTKLQAIIKQRADFIETEAEKALRRVPFESLVDDMDQFEECMEFDDLYDQYNAQTFEAAERLSWSSVAKGQHSQPALAAQSKTSVKTPAPGKRPKLHSPESIELLQMGGLLPLDYGKDTASGQNLQSALAAQSTTSANAPTEEKQKLRSPESIELLEMDEEYGRYLSRLSLVSEQTPSSVSHTATTMGPPGQGSRRGAGNRQSRGVDNAALGGHAPRGGNTPRGSNTPRGGSTPARGSNAFQGGHATARGNSSQGGHAAAQGGNTNQGSKPFTKPAFDPETQRDFSRWRSYTGHPRRQVIAVGNGTHAITHTVTKLEPLRYGGTRELMDLGLCENHFMPGEECPFTWEQCPLRH
ncbi:hypothetical protein BDV95DRAFT_70949 [Massariosphaeria phaeospora]|uniref:C3H1-type domain-containing protein n=1 Tax=Massariosphaeria phaeospora TaxID=100035 RepID=A0A7C8M7M6_9PLEO|nr:hypothetical protein BDV95DRAFT_70949 [Massariosphaeria phaeospora]